MGSSWGGTHKSFLYLTLRLFSVLLGVSLDGPRFSASGVVREVPIRRPSVEPRLDRSLTTWTFGSFSDSSSSGTIGRHPQTTTAAGRCLSAWCNKRRLLAEAVCVTQQVLTTTRSGNSVTSTSARSYRSRSSRICWLSYWLTLQPSVKIAKLRMMWYNSKVVVSSLQD